MDRMRDLLEQQGVTDVAVPKVYHELTSRRLLVSEWVDGIKLSDCEPEEIKELTKIGQEAFLVQLLQVGFFHSDPHPGNLLRPHDQSKARLYLIDFGLVAQVRPEDKDPPTPCTDPDPHLTPAPTFPYPSLPLPLPLSLPH